MNNFSKSIERKMGFLQCGHKEIWVNIDCRNSESNDFCIIFCNPLLEERLSCHPYYVYFSKYLADKGFFVFRFDYRGTGESFPPAKTYSIGKYSQQIVKIIELLRKKFTFKKIGVFGIGSASIPISHVLYADLVDFAVLWEPIINSKRYSKNLFRANLLEQQTIFGKMKFPMDILKNNIKSGGCFTVEGHQITSDFLDSLDDSFLQKINNAEIPMQRPETITIDKLSSFLKNFIPSIASFTYNSFCIL